MISFDPKVYEEAVVKPLRRWSGRTLPDDVVSRYTIDLSMTDAQVTQRLTQVRSHWNKAANSTGKGESVKNVYRAFLRADEELRRTDGAAMGGVNWWRDRAKARAAAREGEVAELAQTLRSSFGDLGLVAAGQLEATRLAVAATLSPDEVEQALRSASVKLGIPVELPRSSGLQDTQYRALKSALTNAGVASVVELLHGRVTSFRILESFRGETGKSGSAGGLTADAVAEATDRENKRSGNAAAREAIGILSTAVRAGADLHQLTLFHLLTAVRDNHDQGVPPAAMLRQLREAGLADDEAGLAVFSVRNETVRQRTQGLGAVKELLAEGRLVAARQMLATIAGAEDASAAKELVERQGQQVRKLRDEAHQALLTNAEGDALHLLRQAAELAVDDDDLAAEVRRIPPQPVLGLTATTEGIGVRVVWRPAPSHDAETSYRLVRRNGRVPVDPDDGAVVVAGDHATVAVDTAVPAGQLVGYAVFAAMAGDSWSRPASVTTEVLPPVHNVQLSADGGAVFGRWQVHAEAVAVQVHRDGVAVPVNGKSAFHDKTAAAGEHHAYSIVAHYRRPDGSMAAAAPMVARTTNRGQLAPVPMLRMTARIGKGAPHVAATWRQPTDAEVTVRRAASPFPWAFGAVVPLGDLAGHGEEVTGATEDQGEWRTLVASAPPGLHHYAPFTMGDSTAVCGQEVAYGVALPVTGLVSQRLGAEVVLSWQWPGEVGTAEVAWSGEAGSGRRRLTRQEYQASGGCRLRCGPGAMSVRVRTVVAAPAGTCTSPDAEITVSGGRPIVSYTVRLNRRPMVGGGTVRVRLTSDWQLSGCTVVVVAAHGPVMPRSPAEGQQVLRTARDIDPHMPVELVAELPRLRKPYWIRCFVEGSTALLVDPPTTQLKVS